MKHKIFNSIAWIIAFMFALVASSVLWDIIYPHDPADLNHDGKVGIEDWSIMDARVFPPNK